MDNSRFLRVSCPRCSHGQTIFGRASLKVKCIKCNRLLVKTTGGKSKVLGKITKIIISNGSK